MYITQGVSMALWLSLCVLADSGDNFLMPRTGFPLIEAMAQNRNIDIKYYDLNDKNEIDFNTIEVDEKTRFLLINNPSNPLGSNWTKNHVQEVCAFCEKHGLPIVADETYEEFVFDGEFVSFGQVTQKVNNLSSNFYNILYWLNL